MSDSVDLSQKQINAAVEICKSADDTEKEIKKITEKEKTSRHKTEKILQAADRNIDKLHNLGIERMERYESMYERKCKILEKLAMSALGEKSNPQDLAIIIQGMKEPKLSLNDIASTLAQCPAMDPVKFMDEDGDKNAED